MRSYLLKRFFISIFVIWSISTLVFFLLHVIPSDPVEMILGQGAQSADIEEMRTALGLDKPLVEQYFDFISGILRADLGRSIISRAPVKDLILSHFTPTLILAISAVFFTLLISFPLALVSVMKEKLDFPVAMLSVAGLAVPNFWLGPLLIIFFSIKLNLFPVSGMGSFSHLILPSITLATALSAYMVRIIRTSLKNELTKGYVLALYSRGYTKSYIFLRHVLPNSMIPVVTVLGLQTGALLTGAIITEKIFSWPGIGTLLINSINQRDYPVIQGVILFIAFVYVGINFVVDVLYTFLDPRVRIGGKSEYKA